MHVRTYVLDIVFGMEINRDLFIEVFEMNRSALAMPDNSSGTLCMYTCEDKYMFDCFFVQKRIEKVGDIKKDTIVVLKDDGMAGGILIFTEKAVFLFHGPIVKEVSYADISWKENGLVLGRFPCPVLSVNQYVLRSILEKVITYNEKAV